MMLSFRSLQAGAILVDFCEQPGPQLRAETESGVETDRLDATQHSLGLCHYV
jgi:hypothetical protein